MENDGPLLGLSEVADLLGTSRQTVGNWRQRRQGFPRPVAELRSGPIWQREVITEWAKANGVTIVAIENRLPPGAPQGAGTTVALMNMKGGVGKSTLTANLGWYCAYLKNRRVLLVDLDPQFNLSQYVLGTTAYEKHLDSKKATILNVFEQGTPLDLSTGDGSTDVTPGNVIAQAHKWEDGSCVDLLPSSLRLSFTLKNPSGKEHLLNNFLEEVRSSYDLILIDCAPTESMLTTSAYLASDSVLIPVKPEFLSTIGLPLVVNSLADFTRSHKKTVEVLGIVFNAATDKIEHDRSRSFVRKTAEREGWYVFRNEVSYSDSYPKGSRIGRPIFLTDYARETKISDFAAVAEEFYERATA